MASFVLKLVEKDALSQILCVDSWFINLALYQIIVSPHKNKLSILCQTLICVFIHLNLGIFLISTVNN